MIDRAIGILGLALAVIFGAWSLAPDGWPKMPAWATLSGIATGILLIGIASGLMIGELREAAHKKFVSDADLRLHVFGDDRLPQRLSAANIYRWYWMKQVLVGVKEGTGEEVRKDIFCTLFISFEVPVYVGTLEVLSPDIRLPAFETKEFNSRFAIIYFHAPVPAGTLFITVHS